MTRRKLPLGFAIGLSLLAGAAASAAPTSGVYDFIPCDNFDTNGQCSPLDQNGEWVGPGSAVHVVDTTGLVGFDVVQPVTGFAQFQITGTDAAIIDSAVDVVFSISLGAFGSVDTDVTSTIDGAVGTVVGDQIQWSGTQELVSNGTVNCNSVALVCNSAGYLVGLNEIVDGANITNGETPPMPVAITLPPFDFSMDGSSLLNTGEFAIVETVPPDQFVALEGALPEPDTTLLLASGLLMLRVLGRHRAKPLG